MIHSDIPSVYQPDQIENLRFRAADLGITALVYASGQIVLIGGGDIQHMWQAACIVAERLAQFCV
jgi:TATA-box binding protein (TBP) (component of TFIID and TFIIIB)